MEPFHWIVYAYLEHKGYSSQKYVLITHFSELEPRTSIIQTIVDKEENKDIYHRDISWNYDTINTKYFSDGPILKTPVQLFDFILS